MDLWLWACALWPAASQASPPEMVTGQWGHPGHVVSGASPSACALFLGGFLLVASAREHEEPPRRLSFLLFFSISTAEQSRARPPPFTPGAARLFRVSHRAGAGIYQFHLDLDPTDSYSPHQFGRQIPLKDFSFPTGFHSNCVFGKKNSDLDII